MKKQTSKNYAVSALLFLLFLIFTVLVKVVDVNAIGPQGSEIGFSAINNAVFNTLGQHSLWFSVSEIAGYIALLVAFAFTVFGFLQVIKRKSIFKADFDILALGGLYVLTVCAYILFELLIINYRPVLIDGVLEASYPSSHTMLAVVIFGSAIMQINRRVNHKLIKIVLNAAMCVFSVVTVIGRLVSGMHWFTDVVGSLLLSAFLLMLYYSVIEIKK